MCVIETWKTKTKTKQIKGHKENNKKNYVLEWVNEGKMEEGRPKGNKGKGGGHKKGKGWGGCGSQMKKEETKREISRRVKKDLKEREREWECVCVFVCVSIVSTYFP